MNITIRRDLVVNTYDIDVAGHVNNIVYIRWLEDLRNILFKKIFDFNEILSRKYYPVVVSTKIKYKKQIKLLDIVTGSLNLVRHRHGIMILSAEIKIDNTIAATADQRCVMINLTDSKMISQNELVSLMTNDFERPKLS